jgi:O-antigen/teichoic acid export membrane protein
MGLVGIATTLGALTYACVTLLLLVSDTDSVTLVVLGAVVAQLVITGVALGSTRGAMVRPVDPPTPRAYRAALAFSLPAGAGELVLLAMLRIDIVLVAAFLPVAEAGLYAVAVALSEVLWVVPDGVAFVTLPTSASDPVARRSRHLVALTAGTTVIGGIVLSLAATPLIDVLFGSAFEDAASAVPLLAVAAVAGGVWKVVGAEIVAAGRTSPRLWSAAAGLGTMVLVDVVAIPSLGIEGAALGAATGYGVAVAVLSRSWPWRTRVRPLVSSAEPSS